MSVAFILILWMSSFSLLSYLGFFLGCQSMERCCYKSVYKFHFLIDQGKNKAKQNQPGADTDTLTRAVLED